MTKGTKVFLTLSIVLIIAGSALFGIGLSMGGKLNTTGFSFSGGTISILQNGGDLVSDQFNLQPFKTLNITTSVTDIYIEKGDNYSISYNVREDFIPVIDTKDDKLIVSCKNNNNNFNFNLLSINTHKDERLTITVPSDCDGINLDLSGSTADIHVSDICVSGKIDLSTGDIHLKNLNGEKLILETSTGDKHIKDCEYEEIEIKSSTGDNKINDSTFTTLKSKSSTGEFKASNTSADFINVSTSTGDVTMKLDGKEKDFDYDIHTSTGDVTVNDKRHKKNYKRDEDSDKKMTIDTTTGDISISFNK